MKKNIPILFLVLLWQMAAGQIDQNWLHYDTFGYHPYPAKTPRQYFEVVYPDTFVPELMDVVYDKDRNYVSSLLAVPIKNYEQKLQSKRVCSHFKIGLVYGLNLLNKQQHLLFNSQGLW